MEGMRLDQDRRARSATSQETEGHGGSLAPVGTTRPTLGHILQYLPSLPLRRARRRSPSPQCPASDAAHWRIWARFSSQSDRGGGQRGGAPWPWLLKLGV